MPAALNQFNKSLDKNQAATLFKLLLKYQPEAKAEKKERLITEAESRASGAVRSQPSAACFLISQLPHVDSLQRGSCCPSTWAIKRNPSEATLHMLEGTHHIEDTRMMVHMSLSQVAQRQEEGSTTAKLLSQCV
jgi:hypothetical protein